MFTKKEKDGSWSDPKVANLRGDNKHEMEAFYTPDGKFIFFSRYNDLNGNPDIYWVDSKILEGKVGY